MFAHQFQGIFYLLFFCCGLNVLFSQQINYQFHHLTIDEGLAHTDATCITQDQQGFIWIGTYFGLNRFDGYELKSFYNQNNPLKNVYTNRINDFCVDDPGRIWLATQGGVACFDAAAETFLILKGQEQDILNEPASHIRFDSANKKLILGNSNGLYFFRVNKSMELEQIQPEQSANIGSIRDLTKNGNTYWVSGESGLFKVKLELEKIEVSSIDVLNYEGNEFQDFDALFIENDQAWIATVKGILETTTIENNTAFVNFYPFDTPTIETDDVPFLKVTALQKWGKILWIGTPNGLLQWNITDKKLSPEPYLKKEPVSKYCLSSNHISNMFIDASNSLWLSTYGGGVNYIDLDQNPFHLLQKDSQNPSNSLTGNFVRTLLEDEEGDLWLGTHENGLNHYSFKTKKFTHFLHDNKDDQSISSNRIRALNFDLQGRLWVGTITGLNIYQGKDRTFKKLFHNDQDPNSLTNDVIFTIGCDKFGQIWAGSWYNGLNKINYQNENDYTIERITTNSLPWKVSSDRITFIYADPELPEVFVGTDNGLNHILLDERGEIAQVFSYIALEKDTGALSSNFVWPIVRTDERTLWVGTIGGGLNKVVLEKNGTYHARHFSVSQGAPSRDIESILLDDNGKLWLGGKGLSMFDPETEKFTNYDVNDGLQSNSFKIGAATKGKNGRLYFGGINGANFFDPNEIQHKQQKVKILLTDLVVNNELVQLRAVKNKWPILEKNINHTSSITLSHLENNFSLSFASPFFANPDKCAYKYRLEGFDEDWIYTDAQNRKASYSNLDYGDYIFKVAGSVGDGIWSDEVALNIAVIAPWWWTNWAKVIYVILVLSIVTGVLFYFTRWYRLKKAYEFTLLEEQQMEELHKMRIQFFTSISHEFRTPLTLILNPLEQLIKGDVGKRKQRRYFQIMHSNTKRMLNLINELMDFRKIESGGFKLHIEKIDIGAFVEDIFEHFREHALFMEVKFDFRSDRLIDNVWIDKKVLEKILVNLLGNSFKFNKVGGKISLEVLEDLSHFHQHYKNEFKIESDFKADDYVWLKVEDNGKGIPAEVLPYIFDRFYRGDEFRDEQGQGTGVGLALVKSMVALHKGQIQVFSEEGKGTCFLVGFPKGKAHFKEDDIVSNSMFKKADIKLPSLADLNASLIKKDSGLGKLPINKPKLLLVEDNIGLRHFVKEHFEEKYHVFEAEHGKEAMEILKIEKPDIIISDVKMPQMDGIELCKIAKQDLTLSHIPFILLTAKTAVENRIEGIRSGADVYLAKPFSIDELELTVSNILDAREKMRQLYVQNAFSEAREIALEGKEKAFMDTILDLIESNIPENDFDVDMLCKGVGMSRTKLYNEIRAITGKSVGELIRSMRLQKAAQILASEDISVVEVMYRVGIQSQSYFTKSFKKEFGKTPSQYVKDL